jgi:hypothetical protein
MILTEKETEAGREKPISIPVFPSQIQREMAWKKIGPLH